MNFHPTFFRVISVVAVAGSIAACSGDDGKTAGPMGIAGMAPPPAGTGAAGTPMTMAGRGGATPGAAGGGAAGRPPAGGAGAAAAGMGGSGGTGTAGMVAAGSMATAGTGAGGMGGAAAGTGAGGMGTAGMSGAGGAAGAAGSGMPGKGMCCDDGDCICRDAPPSSLTSAAGKYNVKSYALAGAGCVYYPTDAEPPFAAVAISDGYLGSGGCGVLAQTSGWGPLYASHGIVAMIIDTTGADQPPTRGRKLTAAIKAFKAENMKSGSPLSGKLAGRYGTSGFSMGGGGTSYSSQADATLKSSVAIMPWGPVTTNIKVPTLVICGTADAIAPCAAHGEFLYSGVGAVNKAKIYVSSGHSGQPSAGGGNSGKYGLAFQKLFLEGDQRWKSLLLSGDAETNIK